MRILYLAHDLGDAAIRRRVRFLRDGGGSVQLVGFRRVRTASASDGVPGHLIGTTRNGRLASRTICTVRAALFAKNWRQEMRAADVVLARSLEMLLIAVVVRRKMRLHTPIVYECLDIHRLMTGTTLTSRVLRGIETSLLRSCALLIVSSPRFVQAYFDRVHRRLPPWTLLENKMLAAELALPAMSGPAMLSQPVLPPWRIGWFGIIRCRRSLLLLAELARQSGGRIEVQIRGRPAYDVIPDFDDVVATTPGLGFGGPYDRATDLPGLYGNVHFNWTLDFYEAGLNSEWLLPNRLYEGSLFGAVPLALASVETGRWFAERGCGVLLETPVQDSLRRFFADLDPSRYRILRQAVVRIDRAALMETTDSAASFVDILRRLRLPNGVQGQVVPSLQHAGAA